MWALLILFLLLPPTATRAEAASVRQVIDGDTLIVSNTQGQTQRIRLYGIDCPEKRQARGREAAEVTRRVTFQQSLDVVVLYQFRDSRH